MVENVAHVYEHKLTIASSICQ